MKLSHRLETILEMVPDGTEAADRRDLSRGMTVADIGCDHGFVSIRLVQDGKAAKVLAMDVRKGPLDRARQHIQEWNLEDRIEVRLSDGLEKLEPEEADGVVIAGMGGDLMLRILEKGAHVRGSVLWWVLSPQSELADFRHGLEILGLRICEERMLKEDGKYYTVMLVRPGRMHYAHEYEYRYGAGLLAEKSLVLKEWLEKEKRQLETIHRQLSGQDGEAAVRRCRQIEKELEELEQASGVIE